ncbi:unnamed protein product [Rotaria sp. Silwood2]|nr:unnamed protein product [Rotaria sp. Silwood2]CAF2633896.1 unnamed protein product [Rotaria sp. Silwood2]CAF3035218.1 unnamed protein product [Rotaria sp. Silwood2]CAF3948108.1 unnamed protein product [Rotaria sp. Silwood2]CAF4075159.1 unnamed protein product [Rotaria sp. Silwood2]
MYVHVTSNGDRAHRALAIEQQSSTLSEQEYIITSVPMQSVILPCKAVSPHVELERVMWYKLTNPGQSTLNVGTHLITKDSRFSVDYYSVDHGYSPAKWDLHITNVRLSDAAHYQCHVVRKDNHESIRSNIKLVVEDIIVDIQPIDVLVSIGDKTKFSCNFTGEYRVRREKVTWLKDNTPLAPDTTRVTTSIELPNVTVTTLEIAVTNLNDSGSYRCSDGHGARSKEAKLYLRDTNQQLFLRSLSSKTSISSLLSFRTVFYLLIFQLFLFIL